MKELSIRIRRRRFLRAVTLIVVVIFTGIILVLQAKSDISGKQYTLTEAIAEYIARVVKFCMDMFIAIMFARHLHFFYKMKQRSLKATKKANSSLNLWVLGLIISLFIMKCYHATMNLIFNRLMILLSPPFMSSRI